MSNPVISIVLCTYNGETLLPACFQSIVDQTADKSKFELVVVNNNSTDHSQQVAEAFAAVQPNVRVYMEPKVGLSAARNRGFQEADGDYVAYLDDDAKLTPDWVKRALEIIHDRQPDIFGGPIFPFYQVQKPEWFKDEFGTYNNYNETGPLASDRFLSGSNIVFSRLTFDRLGGFDEDFGMKGEEMGYGEETVMLQRARREIQDVQIYYDYDLRVLHLVPHYKMQMLYFLVNAFASGRSWAKLNRLTGKDDGYPKFQDLKDFLRTVTDIYNGSNQLYKRSTKGELHNYESFVLESIVPAISNLGVLHERISHSVSAFNPGNKLIQKLKGRVMGTPFA